MLLWIFPDSVPGVTPNGARGSCVMPRIWTRVDGMQGKFFNIWITSLAWAWLCLLIFFLPAPYRWVFLSLALVADLPGSAFVMLFPNWLLQRLFQSNHGSGRSSSPLVGALLDRAGDVWMYGWLVSVFVYVHTYTVEGFQSFPERKQDAWKWVRPGQLMPSLPFSFLI